MKVAWVCEFPASSFPGRPSLRHAPPSHPVPWITVQAPRVAASGIELHIVTVSKHIAADDEFVSEGIHFHFLKIPRLPRAALAYQVDRARIRRCLANISPDLVQGFGTESSFGYSAVTSPFPSLLMIQGIVARITRARGVGAMLRQPALVISRLVEWLTVRAARHVVCETEFAAAFVREINPAAVTYVVRTPVLDMWFDVTRVAHGRADAEVLFVGFVVPAKGPDILLRAFARVAAAFPIATLHIAGAAEPRYLRDTLMPAVTRLNLTGRVQFHGTLGATAIADRLARASVLVLPTLMDTAPNVVAEARAAGVPVVASAVGGIPELIDDGVDGVLVPPGSPERLAEAILEVLSNVEAASAIGACGRARVRREHSLSIQVPVLLDVYRRVLANAKVTA